MSDEILWVDSAMMTPSLEHFVEILRWSSSTAGAVGTGLEGVVALREKSEADTLLEVCVVLPSTVANGR